MRLLYRMFSTRSKGCNHIQWLHSTWSVLLVWQSSLLPATIGGPSDEPDVCLASDTLQARLNRKMANQFSYHKKGYLPHWLGRWYGKNVKLGFEFVKCANKWSCLILHRIPHFHAMHRAMHPWKTTSIPDLGKFLYRQVSSLKKRKVEIYCFMSWNIVLPSVHIS